jgi:hypothetical protein
MRPEVAVDTERCCGPLTRCAVSQKRLQGANDISGRTILEGWHGTAVRQSIPSEHVNRTADRQASALLKVLYCGLDLRSKDAVNRKSEVRSAAQCTLQASYRGTRGAKRDR